MYQNAEIYIVKPDWLLIRIQGLKKIHWTYRMHNFKNELFSIEKTLEKDLEIWIRWLREHIILLILLEKFFKSSQAKNTY